MASRKPKDGKCGSRLKQRPGWFCTNDPMDGVTRCRMHGGASPALQEKRAEGKSRKALHAMVTAIDADDIEANPLVAYDVEFRKTVAAIRWLDEKVSSILTVDEEDFVWGQAEEKEINSGEWPGTDRTYRAALTMWETKRQWERDHLVDMTKLFVSAKLDERVKMLDARVLESIDAVLTAFARGLGHDPADANTRKVLTEAFASVGVTAPRPAEGKERSSVPAVIDG